jgi:hypothetical protein
MSVRPSVRPHQTAGHQLYGSSWNFVLAIFDVEYSNVLRGLWFGHQNWSWRKQKY